VTALVLSGLLACGSPPPVSREELTRLHQQAVQAQNAGDYEKAEALHRQVVDAMARAPELQPADEARQLTNLASVLNVRNKPVEALALLQRARAMFDAEPSVDPQLRAALHLNLGRSYALMEDWTEAERQYRQGMSLLEARGGPRDALAFTADANLAYVYWKTGRLAEAKPLYEEALTHFRRAVGSNHPVVRQWEQEYAALVEQMERR
jgi:tetratricopeptide (TPR) repeat protein